MINRCHKPSTHSSYSRFCGDTISLINTLLYVLIITTWIDDKSVAEEVDILCARKNWPPRDGEAAHFAGPPILACRRFVCQRLTTTSGRNVMLWHLLTARPRLAERFDGLDGYHHLGCWRYYHLMAECDRRGVPANWATRPMYDCRSGTAVLNPSVLRGLISPAFPTAWFLQFIIIWRCCLRPHTAGSGTSAS